MKTVLLALCIVAGAALTAGMCVDAYKQYKHDTALIATKIEAYTAGRAQAIEDMTNPNSATTTTSNATSK